MKQYLIMALLCGTAAFGVERAVFRSAPAQTADTAATRENPFAGTATATTGNRMTERSTGGKNRAPYRKSTAPPAANPPPGGSDALPRTDSGFAGASSARLDGRIVYRDVATTLPPPSGHFCIFSQAMWKNQVETPSRNGIVVH